MVTSLRLQAYYHYYITMIMNMLMIQPAAPGGSHAAATGPTPPKAQIKNTIFSLSSFGEKGKIGDQQCTK